MARYCLALDHSAEKVWVHNQRCREYHDTHLMMFGHASDLGEFPNIKQALGKAQETFPLALPCVLCAIPGTAS